MTITGSTNSIEWGYKLEVNEIATSVQERTSTIEVKTYVGRTRSWNQIGGYYTNNVSVTGASSQSQTGSIPWPTSIDAGGWYHLKTFTFVVPNTSNPTTITISSELKDTNFSPSYGSANGTMQLTILHLDPTIQTAQMVETNSVLTALNVPNTTVVQYLSKKTITLHATAEDDATLKYRLRHLNTNYALPSATTFQDSNTFNTDYTQNDIVISSGKANIIQDVGDSLNGLTTNWVYVDISGTPQKPNGIAYSKPKIERTTSGIRRKSGNGTNLTDNKANLTLKASFYKETDVIGNNNNIQQIGYKVWESGTSEPTSYTTLTPTISGGNILVDDLEISNIDFTKVYNYKIIVKDRYNYQDIIEDGVIPTGQSLWTEYKDRVDFLKLTVEQNNPFEYSTNEIKISKWINGKPIYRKVIQGTLSNNNITISNAYIIKVYGFVQARYGQWWPMPGLYSDSGYNNFYYLNSDRNQITIDYNGYYDTSSQYEIIVEYTKTTD